MTPEGRIKAKLSKALIKLGTDCYRFMPVQSGYGAKTLDYLLCIKGRFVSFETKAPGKKLTSLQEATKAAMEAAGGVVMVVSDDESLNRAMIIVQHIIQQESTYVSDGSNDTIRKLREWWSI